MYEHYGDRLVTPAMPRCLAYVCCILNFIIPGSGTVIAGMSSFCFAVNDDLDFGYKCTACCCGLLMGFLQLVFTGFLLIGWCWSAIWGCSYIDQSKKYYRSSTRSSIGPVTSQPRRRLIIRAHNRQTPGDVSVISSGVPHDFVPPPPSYYDPERGVVPPPYQASSDGYSETPPSYNSLFPDRIPKNT